VNTQLIAMLRLQDAMNTKVNEHWRDQGFAWYRAIWTECAELLDHYGWKWWKKQLPDVDQVKLELVDIWHFGLSILLLSGKSDDHLAGDIAKALASPRQGSEFRDTLEQFTLATLQSRNFDMPLFAGLMVHMEMDLEELYVRYVGKNVLNFFRQDHGYKDGSYRKSWGDMEDNEHLVEVVAELDTGSANFKDELYNALSARYRQLT
jgi:dimeric dUTPase (all-alpha-NTP-PPase superfamily)